MMNKFRKIIAVAMAAVVVIAGSSVMQVQAGSKTIGLNINCSKLMKGDSFKLRVEYNETAQKLSKVKWSTDDAKVAKISKECKSYSKQKFFHINSSFQNYSDTNFMSSS